MTKKVKLIASLVIFVLIFVLSIQISTRYRLKYVEVYTVNKILNSREKIGEKDLIKHKLPKAFVDDSTVLKKEEALNHYVKLNHTLYPNSVLNKNSIESLSMSKDQALLGLRENEKLFSMKAGPLESLGNMLRSGHYVDVYLRYSKSYDKKESYKLASSIRVLGLKDRNGEDVEESKTNPHTILLAIDENEIDYFIQAQAEGDLVLTGSNSKDRESKYFRPKEDNKDEL